jgi:hypothetical protein
MALAPSSGLRIAAKKGGPAGARAFSVGHGEGRRAGLIRLPVLKPGANRQKCGAKSTPERVNARAIAKMSAISQMGRTGRLLEGEDGGARRLAADCPDRGRSGTPCTEA